MGCGGSKTAGTTPRGGRNTKDNKKGRNNQGGKGNNQGKGKGNKNKQPVNEKGYKKRIRENLRHAAAGNDIDELQKCMEIFDNNHMEDGGDYTEAEQRLDFLQVRKEIRDACMRRHPVVLEKAIQRVEASPYKRQLNAYLNRAYYLKKHQNELDTFRHDISDLDQSTISEIRSYHHPPNGVHETMCATYMIIGYPEKHLLDWTEITALMGRYGKDSLIREVQTVDPNKIDKTTALRARNYLGQYSLEEIRVGSTGAAAFYVWASKMVGKPDGKATKGEDTSPKKLTNSGGKGQQASNKGDNQPKTPTASMRDENTKQAKQQSNMKQKNNAQNNAKNNTKQTQNTAKQTQNTAKQTQNTAKQTQNTAKQTQNTAKQGKDNKTKQANGSVKAGSTKKG
ncbi:uncharacterized protein LOC132749161 isoform X2 [Ruditapes philippinarum]|uniref:uncharacterized protein LOC132749161 isoform X2 n=1 Tax=Ruditapes philippinarum TaxID=129788 RepID=UPI00295BAEA5|nr:uncharacterized protein LOC132749161 isoform X2 [Ruditapes philippinarum]